MIRSPAGFDGEIRIKRYMDYYQASYGVMMLSSGQFGAGTAAGYLLGSEPSGYATDFTAGGVQGNALVRSSPRNTQMDYSGTPFLAQGGPVTFSRGSLATVTDSDGYINWAQHNLLLASEQFDASNWTVNSAGVTITANAVAAPNGSITADALVGDGASSAHFTGQGVSLSSAETYKVGVYVKANGVNFIQFFLSGGSGIANFNITSGAGAAGTSVAPFGSLSVQDVGSGWYYCSATITNPANPAIYIALSNSASAARAPSFTTSGSIYIWGAHIYRSDLGGMQANASAYPYYNPSTPKNLLGYSEAFDNAAWTKGNASISANAIAAPNGSLSADKIVEDTNNSGHFILQTNSVGATTITISVYAKAAGRDWLQIRGGLSPATQGAYFNLATGSNGSTPSAGVTAAIVPAGNGWYRCSITLAVSAGTNVTILSIASADNTASYTGDGTSGIYLWGAQLSDSASLDPYVGSYGAAPSAAAAYGPRLDYDPSTLAAKGLLVEEQRTNLLRQSNTPTVASWIFSNTTGTANTTEVPDPAGTNTATKLVSNASGGAVLQSVTSTAVAHTASVWLRTASGTLSIQFSLYRASPFAVVATTVLTVTSTWQRFTLTGTFFDTTAHNFQYGTGTSATIYSYGAQLEVGSFATSYIPTAAATVTRNADVAFVATSQFPYSATEGALVVSADYIGQSPSNAYAAALNDGTASNFMAVRRNPTGETIFVTFATTLQVAIPYTTVTNNVAFKNAFSYKLNDFAGAANGAITGTDTSGTVPSVSRLGLGNVADLLFMNGHIRQITYIPRRLTNAELIARST